MPSKPSKSLASFPNPSPGRDYLIRMQIPEFTCLCPMTGQPDFATLFLDYVPDRKCVELKSLKLYVWSFRNEGAFHEAVTNRIGDDLVKLLSPRLLRLAARFFVRGGITTSGVVEHRKAGFRLAHVAARSGHDDPQLGAGSGIEVSGARIIEIPQGTLGSPQSPFAVSHDGEVLHRPVHAAGGP